MLPPLDSNVMTTDDLHPTGSAFEAQLTAARAAMMDAAAAMLHPPPSAERGEAGRQGINLQSRQPGALVGGWNDRVAKQRDHRIRRVLVGEGAHTYRALRVRRSHPAGKRATHAGGDESAEVGSLGELREVVRIVRRGGLRIESGRRRQTGVVLDDDARRTTRIQRYCVPGTRGDTRTAAGDRAARDAEAEADPIKTPTHPASIARVQPSRQTASSAGGTR